MSEPAINRAAIPAPSPIATLELRSWARAYLWWAGEYSLHEAVDKLLHDAERDGLVDELGEDGVQQILAAAFAQFFEAEQ